MRSGCLQVLCLCLVIVVLLLICNDMMHAFCCWRLTYYDLCVLCCPVLCLCCIVCLLLCFDIICYGIVLCALHVCYVLRPFGVIIVYDLCFGA